MGIDQAIAQAFHSFIGTSPVFDTIVVFCASGIPYLALFIFVLAVIRWYRTGIPVKQSLYVILTTLLSLFVSRGIIVYAIRFFYHRPRPFAALNWEPLVEHLATDPSFPSGHATVLFAVAASVWFFDRRYGWILFTLAALNAVARVYVGVHWPSDVIVGALVGIAVSFGIKKLLPLY